MIANDTLIQTMDLIEQRTGLAIDPRRDAHRRQDLIACLETLTTEHAQNDPRELLRLLRAQPIASGLWQAIIEPLAIGETYFFRDDTQFQLLEEEVLPALIAQRRQQNHLYLSLWSAGCATGEEPYSLAILLRRLLPDIDRWNLILLGTDINRRALEIAQKGIYRSWSFRLRHLDLSSAFQTITGDGQNLMQVRPEIRRMVRFECRPLLERTEPSASETPVELQPRFDIVFCRNVLLYFSSPQMRQAEQVLMQSVAPSGWLFLGHSENLSAAAPAGWERHPAIPVYHRLDGLRPAPFFTSSADDTESSRPITRRDLTAPAVPSVSAIPATRSPTLAMQDNEETRYRQAVGAYRDHRLDDAEQIARTLIFSRPDHASALLLLAYIAADRQDIDAARSYIDRVLRQDRLNAEAYYLRSMLHEEAGESDQAEAELRAALYCQRDHPLALYRLGKLKNAAGDEARAALLWTSLEHALENRDDDAFINDYSDLRVRHLRELAGQ